jgi:hypothetical protein
VKLVGIRLKKAKEAKEAKDAPEKANKKGGDDE